MPQSKLSATSEASAARAAALVGSTDYAALKKAGGAGAEAVAVGDSPYDVQAAGEAGLGTVALRSGGFGDDALRRVGATALFDDAAALLAGFDTSPLGA